MKKRIPWSLIVIIAVIFIGSFLILIPDKTPPSNLDDFVSCISKKTTLYTQEGCHACEKQENIFGDSYEKLNVVDCFDTPELCQGITGTPTWKIGDELYVGVMSLEALAKITKCELKLEE